MGALVYANSLDGAFVFDDIDSVGQNPHLRQLLPWSHSLSAPPGTPPAGRPVVALSLALNYAVGGLDVRGYRVFNVAVHLLNALILYGVVRRTLLSARLRSRFEGVADVLALACALVWMVHPLQTECVNYISQRTESMAAVFYLLTLYGVIRGINSARGRWWYAASVLTCALGMATKEVMVTAPFIVLLYDRVFFSDSFREIARRRGWLYLGLAATWLILAGLMWSGPRSETVGFGRGVSGFTYALNQCVMITTYLRLIFWPHPLLLDYGSPGAVTLGDVWPLAALLAVLVLATIVLTVRGSVVGIPGAWFFVILAPTSTIVPIVSEVGAERRVYLASAGVIVLIMVGGYVLLHRAADRFRSRQARPSRGPSVASAWVGAVIVLAVTIACVALTVRRNLDYRSETGLWSASIAARPQNPRAHNNLGELLLAEGILDEAIRHFREAIRITPDLYAAHSNLGNALGVLGSDDEAIEHHLVALNARPEDPNLLNNLAWVLATRRDHRLENAREAVRLAEKAVALSGPNADILDTLAAAYAATGQFNRARSTARRALTLALADSNRDLAGEIESRLVFYRSDTAYRR